MRSCATVTGYHIEANDGAIGHVADFIVDDHTWEIHYVVVDTSNWWLGHSVMFAPQWLHSVNWLEATVSVDLTMDTIRNAPPLGSVADLGGQPGADVHGHTPRQGYWATETDRVLGRSY